MPSESLMYTLFKFFLGANPSIMKHLVTFLEGSPHFKVFTEGITNIGDVLSRYESFGTQYLLQKEMSNSILKVEKR